MEALFDTNIVLFLIVHLSATSSGNGITCNFDNGVCGYTVTVQNIRSLFYSDEYRWHNMDASRVAYGPRQPGHSGKGKAMVASTSKNIQAMMWTRGSDHVKSRLSSRPSAEHLCGVEFYYVVNGQNLGSLNVYISAGGQEQRVMSINRAQGGAWKRGFADVSKYNKNIKVTFESVNKLSSSVRSTSYDAHIVDDVSAIPCACTANPCKNGGKCLNTVTSEVVGYTCQCAAGTTGTKCETFIDPCMKVDCGKNGRCASNGSSFWCQCYTGYAGSSCQVNINDCVNNACQNGATCVDKVNGYACICLSGFSGKKCESNINDCAQDSCQNGGSCVDEVASFSCLCQAGYTGQLCEIDIDDCANVSCKNLGRCKDLVNGFQCHCPLGFMGQFCDTNIDDCLPNVCHNRGRCVDGIASFSCECHNGYGGNQCEINIDDCSLVHCKNNGTCLDLVADFVCQCPFGYSGKFCEVNVNDCPPNACGSGGTCMDLVGTYKCVCDKGFTGDHCESKVPPSCGGNLNNTEGFIVSPGYPVSYANNLSCVWRIAAGVGQRLGFSLLNMVLESSPNCAKDYLMVENTMTLTPPPVVRFCGHKYTYSFTSIANTATVTLSTDAGGTAGGFMLYYQVLGCSSQDLPSIHPNARLLNPHYYYPYGYIARYECNSGYTPANDNNDTEVALVCSSDHTWQGPPVTCVKTGK